MVHQGHRDDQGVVLLVLLAQVVGLQACHVVGRDGQEVARDDLVVVRGDQVVVHEVLGVVHLGLEVVHRPTYHDVGLEGHLACLVGHRALAHQVDQVVFAEERALLAPWGHPLEDHPLVGVVVLENLVVVLVRVHGDVEGRRRSERALPCEPAPQIASVCSGCKT